MNEKETKELITRPYQRKAQKDYRARNDCFNLTMQKGTKERISKFSDSYNDFIRKAVYEKLDTMEREVER